MPTNPKWAAGQVPQPRVLVDPETGTVLGTTTNPLAISNEGVVDGAAVAGSLTATGVLFTADMAGYGSITVQVVSAGSSCTITYEVSEDQVTWYGTSYILSTHASSGNTSNSSSTGVALSRFGRHGRYFRARVSTYGSGTVTVAGSLSKMAAVNFIAVGGTSSQGLPVQGQNAAHDAAITGTPVRIGARALSANYTPVSTGDTADLVTTLVGAQIIRPYSLPEADWQYAAASGGITDTSDVTIAAAPASGLRNYLTGIQLINTDATVGTEVVIKDGSTVIFRTFVPASLAAVTQPIPAGMTFPTPIRQPTTATALTAACITTSSQTYINAQGYVAP